jgi:hypothetical protein
MDMPTAGIVTIAFSLLLSRKLGWHADPARIPLLIATVLFAFALCFPTIGALEQETGWILAGHLASALGGLVLVIALLAFERKGAKPDARRVKRKPKKQATAPPTGSTDELPAPDPDDPYAGPHGG